MLGRGKSGAKAVTVDERRISPRPSIFGDRLAWLGRHLAGLVTEERRWLDGAILFPLPLAVGIALYFAAPEEPSHLYPCLVAFGLGAAALWRRHRGHEAIFLSALAILALGFAAGALRTALVDAPLIEKGGQHLVTGLVLGVEPRANGGARLLIRPTAIEGIEVEDLPALLRLTVRHGGIAAGQSLTLSASLRPPPPPVQPGGYDFARDAYFSGIGGVGYAFGEVSPAPAITPTFGERWAIALDLARNRLTERIYSIIGGDAGALAAAQVTGLRGHLSEDATGDMRASGLYHIVSISGLHMAIFAGGLFFAIRAVLALFPTLALRWPIKTVAALVALVPAFAYTIFSGAEVATVRAFLMTGIVLIGVALERKAATRRNVALAASGVLLVSPESLFAPGFQMSFAAVAMLVAWHERPRATPRDPPTITTHATRFIGAMVATTVIATIATTPFAAFHFHRITLQGVVSNLLATPIVSGLVMPLSLVSLAAEPFGYGPFFWKLTGYANEAVLQIAERVAAFPGANIPVHQFGAGALTAFSIALLVLSILRTRLALLAIAPLATGLTLAATAERPVAFVGANGYAAIAQGPQGLGLVGEPRDAFAIHEWLAAIGDGREMSDPAFAERLCSASRCRLTLPNGDILAVDRTDVAVDRDCNRVAILVTPRYAPDECRDAALVIDRGDLAQAGAFAIYRTDTGYRFVPARDNAVSRPWTGGD